MDNEHRINDLVHRLNQASDAYYGGKEEQITNYDLTGYHFYIYAVPFIKKGDTCIDSTRKKIIEYIQWQ